MKPLNVCHLFFHSQKCVRDSGSSDLNIEKSSLRDGAAFVHRQASKIAGKTDLIRPKISDRFKFKLTLASCALLPVHSLHRD